jgi:hypothetical protein
VGRTQPIDAQRKAEALGIAEREGASEASKRTGIPAATIRAWRHREAKAETPPDVDDVERLERLVAEQRAAAEESLAKAPRRGRCGQGDGREEPHGGARHRCAARRGLGGGVAGGARARGEVGEGAGRADRAGVGQGVRRPGGVEGARPGPAGGGGGEAPPAGGVERRPGRPGAGGGRGPGARRAAPAGDGRPGGGGAGGDPSGAGAGRGRRRPAAVAAGRRR